MGWGLEEGRDRGELVVVMTVGSRRGGGSRGEWWSKGAVAALAHHAGHGTVEESTRARMEMA